ncbi:hypothetical protein PFISCL1PPCAC_4293 [Pristionchus fissidentatus]|uniref:Uncharacterized protein n=1 Tax=Pristionchus fissidentatus TaxID=1538716 RepID=A0AAV5V2L1_9BILA|nr:hypothetical protein PFISCL1PPCAC_4293 [Pristionchus fissidentatus]
MRISGILLLAGCFTVAALPDLDEAPKLTLDELVGAGTFAPPTLAPDTTHDFGIPPNPEARRSPIKGIRLPVFDPTQKFDGPPLVDENRARFVPMPKGSFHIEFDKSHPYPDYNISQPITLDLSKFISNKYECAFCLKIVSRLKEDIQKKGAQAFTEELQHTCQAQKEIGQWQTSCELIDKVKVERMNAQTAEAVCISEKRCKSEEETKTALLAIDALVAAQKDEDEMREKWKKENEKARQIVEAEEEKWRRDFKRTHNETFGIKPLLLNLPEGHEGSGDDGWKPDFGGWTLGDHSNETTTETVPLSTQNFGVEEKTAEGAEGATTESSNLSKFTIQAKPTSDFLHEVLGESVQKDDSTTPTTTAATSGTDGDVVEEPAVSSVASPVESSVVTTTPEGGAMETSSPVISSAGVLGGLMPGTDEAGPEPTTLFSTTTEANHFTKSDKEVAGEEEARRTLQSTILEAKKTVDEDVGFMSKPVVIPRKDGGSAINFHVNLHEFVSPHHLGTASSPKSTVDAASVDEAPAVAAAVQPNLAANIDAGETTISPPVRAPVQCDPVVKKKQFSAHPAAAAAAATGAAGAAVAASADSPADTAAAVEPEATKLEITGEQEGPANMAIAKARPMRIVNRVVNAEMQVDDIARY